MRELPNIIDELCFYRRYHYNNVNVAIHMIFIPVILFTSMWILTFVRFPFVTSALGINHLAVYANGGVLLSFLFGTFYALLDTIYGVPSATLLTTLAIEFSTRAPKHGLRGALVAAALWLFAWACQFAGHFGFEHRAPALVDSLLQALVLAPFFVVFEIGHLLGLRRDIMAKVDQIVGPEIARLKAGQNVQVSEAAQIPLPSEKTAAISKPGRSGKAKAGTRTRRTR